MTEYIVLSFDGARADSLQNLRSGDQGIFKRFQQTVFESVAEAS